MNFERYHIWVDTDGENQKDAPKDQFVQNFLTIPIYGCNSEIDS